MLVTIAPASAKTGSAVIRSLLSGANSTVKVQGVYRDTSKAPAEFTSHKNFKAVKGDVSNESSLDFAGSDVVIAITPPGLGGDIVATARQHSQNVKNAIEKSGTVTKLVLLSSVGAQFTTGVGEIKTNNAAESVFSTTKVPDITFVRCSYFMENWATSLATLGSPEPFFFSTITPLDWKLPMVAVADIGSTIAAEAVKKGNSNGASPAAAAGSKPLIYELHGPRMYTPLDVQLAFADALGKQVAVKPVEKKDLHGFFAQVFPADIVGEFVEMATSFLPGGIMKPGEVEKGVGVKEGKTELGDAIKDLVQPLLS